MRFREIEFMAPPDLAEDTRPLSPAAARARAAKRQKATDALRDVRITNALKLQKAEQKLGTI